ncbi:DUF269 domain-containing protein [Limisalsivibrio acetivorans]|uniref:DUF269 domain-containing protein n=1 Tax=Limisalsivibrio acetivorans TaxID=1304888 RepID=UPI0003B67F4D|nr:DUF269 domain-containing protein [Limisalsivibrio acetivorans]
MRMRVRLDNSDLASQSEYLQTLAKKLRSFDTFGTWKRLSDERILEKYVLSREDKKKISTSGAVKTEKMFYIRMFYEASAQLIEMKTGLMCIAVADINHEGFGRVLIVTGDYILSQRVLRNAHKFGFESLEEMMFEGEGIAAEAVQKAEELKITA